MKSIKQITLILLALVCVFAFLYVWFVALPVMLVSGLIGTIKGITLAALSVVVPGVLLWNYFKGKSTN